jgi:hypothetical protein
VLDHSECMSMTRPQVTGLHYTALLRYCTTSTVHNIAVPLQRGSRQALAKETAGWRRIRKLLRQANTVLDDSDSNKALSDLMPNPVRLSLGIIH